MSAAGEQQLADLAWFLVEVGLNEATAVDPDVDVEKVDSPCVDVVLKSELYRWVEVVAVLHELDQLLLVVLPTHPYIPINIDKLYLTSINFAKENIILPEMRPLTSLNRLENS